MLSYPLIFGVLSRYTQTDTHIERDFSVKLSSNLFRLLLTSGCFRGCDLTRGLPPSLPPFPQGDESLHAQRITLTVKDFNYYIGHAYAASSRLQIAMQMGPPRYVKLVAPRRTEMRRVLQQLRDMPPQRPEPGYIIDIQRDEEGDAGDAAPAGDVAPTLSGGQEEGGLRYGGSRRFGPISIGASIDLGGLQPHQILPHTTVGEGGEIKEEDEEKKEEGEAKEEEGEAKEGEASTAKTEAEPVQEQPPEAEGATAKEPAEVPAHRALTLIAGFHAGEEGKGGKFPLT